MDKPLLFIIDDSLSNLLLLQSVFLEQNIDVMAFNNPKNALHTIKDTIPDIVLLDLMMPEMSGFQFLKSIRNTNIPVIIISAKNDPKTQRHAFQLGAVDYFTKPVNIQKLVHRINHILHEYNLNTY